MKGRGGKEGEGGSRKKGVKRGRGGRLKLRFQIVLLFR